MLLPRVLVDRGYQDFVLALGMVLVGTGSDCRSSSGNATTGSKLYWQRTRVAFGSEEADKIEQSDNIAIMVGT
eukprot:1732359-Rhodomonas_salina.2